MTIDEQNDALAAIDRATQGLVSLRRTIEAQNRPACPDAHNLLRAIAHAFVGAAGDLPPVQVAVVTSDPDSYLLYAEALEGQGVVLTEARPGPRGPQLEGKKAIFFDLGKVRRFLLPATQWRGLDCEQLLARVAGATRQQRVLGRKRERVWGTEVPLASWQKALATPTAAVA